MEYIKQKLIALLGLSDLRKCLLAEINQLRDDLEYLESQYDDTKYLAEDLESQVSELESKADDFEYNTDNIRTDLESDFQGLKDEINQMKEGYVLNVKLTREVY
jgi:predicted  nucleic acid-binding Zn-ribbon protein